MRRYPTYPERGVPQRCAWDGCNQAHYHPVTGAPPDYHWVIGTQKEPRWYNPLKKGKNPFGHWFTTAELAALLGVHRCTVIDWARRGLIAFTKPGYPDVTKYGRYRFRGDDVQAFLDRSTRYVPGVTPRRKRAA